MIVVADSSPLISLAKIDCLICLHQLFGSVQIPEQVQQELEQKNAAQGGADVLDPSNNWLIVRSPQFVLTLPGLHPGEAAAISLAIEQSATLLIDEKAGRKSAQSYGIKVIGTVGVLMEAAERGMIELRGVFDRLKATDFRFPEQRLSQLLTQFEERQSNPPTN